MPARIGVVMFHIRYGSFDADPLALHALWLRAAGVDFIVVGWANNMWGLPSWAARGVHAQEITNATIMLETLAGIRPRGCTTSAVVLLLGPTEPIHSANGAATRRFIASAYLGNASNDGM